MINTGNCRSEAGAKTGKSRKSTKWQKHLVSLNNRYALRRKETLAKAAQFRAGAVLFEGERLSMKIVAASLALIVALYAPNARADMVLDWDVGYSSQVADYDANPVNGLERKNEYTIDNLTTSSSDAGNMIQVTFNAGSNQGVVYANENTGNWVVDIQDNKTVFSGNGSYIGPDGGDNTFYLYTPENQLTGNGIVEALAAGNVSAEPFNDKTTTLPIPEPMSIGLLAIGTALIGGYRRFIGRYK